MSLARVTVNQKQQQHSSELEVLILDRERSLFRIISAPFFARLGTNNSVASSPKGQALHQAAVQQITGIALQPFHGAPSGSAAAAEWNEQVGLSHGNYSRSMSSNERGGGGAGSGAGSNPSSGPGSLLKYFHIPSDGSGRPQQPHPSTPAGTHVHELAEQDFAEAQLAQAELKRLHIATSSIVTVGSGGGLFPSVPLQQEPDDSDREADEAERKHSFKGVRFDAAGGPLSAARRSFKRMPTFVDAAALSVPAITCHTVRLHDFKLLLTVEIRSTLLSLVDQYVASINEMLEKQKSAGPPPKYNRRGKLLADHLARAQAGLCPTHIVEEPVSDSDDDSTESEESTMRSMLEACEETVSPGGTMLGGGARRGSDIADPPSMLYQFQARSPSPSSSGSSVTNLHPLQQLHPRRYGSTGSDVSVESTGSADPPSTRMSGAVSSMADLLEQEEDEPDLVDANGVALPVHAILKSACREGRPRF